MVFPNEAEPPINSETRPKLQTDCLLDKYNIPIHHFEYTYIETCNDGRELERIVKVLRSGEEGYFPDLARFAENRLSVVKPKSKLLRGVCPVVPKESLGKDEQDEITSDLCQWISNVSKNDDELSFFKNRKSSNILPDVRETQEISVQKENNQNTTKRISATDYPSWDKYDPDTEILKMDLEEERVKRSAVHKHAKKPIRKTVQFKEFSTESEAAHEANYEKDKGNEYFKAGDYEEALKHYTNSITSKPTSVTYTNRALTNIKLKQYKNAVDDCNSALSTDPNNIKAFMRKAQALDALNQHHEALESIGYAIRLDPNNTLAQELAEKYRKRSGHHPKTATRLAIQDVDESKRLVIVPIPGTSRMPPPHYITCKPEQVEEETRKVNTPTQILHMITVDNSDADDDYGCSSNVGHLRRKSDNEKRNKTVERRKQLEITTDDKEAKEKSLMKEQNAVECEAVKQKPKKADPEDRCAGGEPYTQENLNTDMPEDIHAPYSFLKTWNSANGDKTLEQHASILRSLDMNRIVEVIGCKLDNAMFSTIIKCLSVHFAVPGEVDRLYFILTNVINLPRFDIIAMLMSPTDRHCVTTLVNFLKQHGKPVSHQVFNKFL